MQNLFLPIPFVTTWGRVINRVIFCSILFTAFGKLNRCSVFSVHFRNCVRLRLDVLPKFMYLSKSAFFLKRSGVLHDFFLMVMHFLKERLELPVIHQAVAAFTACVARVGANIEPPRYVINDSDVFEGVVRLCFAYLGKALLELIGRVKTDMDDEEPDSNFKKVRKYTKKQSRCWKNHGNLIKSYLHALLQVIYSCNLQFGSQSGVAHEIKTTVLLIYYYCYV